MRKVALLPAPAVKTITIFFKLDMLFGDADFQNLGCRNSLQKRSLETYRIFTSYVSSVREVAAKTSVSHGKWEMLYGAAEDFGFPYINSYSLKMKS